MLDHSSIQFFFPFLVDIDYYPNGEAPISSMEKPFSSYKLIVALVLNYTHLHDDWELMKFLKLSMILDLQQGMQ